MTISSFLRALAAGAFLLLATPMANAAVNPPSSPGYGVASAKALIEEGKFNEALILLQPLVRDRNAETDVLFLIGLAATGASQQPGVSGDVRDTLLDAAIESLRIILINRPGLVRVRLELARAFFLKGDGLPPMYVPIAMLVLAR